MADHVMDNQAQDRAGPHRDGHVGALMAGIARVICLCGILMGTPWRLTEAKADGPAAGTST